MCVCVEAQGTRSYCWSSVSDCRRSRVIPPHLVAAVGLSGASQNSLKDIQPRSPTTGYKLNLCFKFFNNFYINPYPIVCAYCLCLCTLFQDLVFCSSAVHLTILDKQWLGKGRSTSSANGWTPGSRGEVVVEERSFFELFMAGQARREEEMLERMEAARRDQVAAEARAKKDLLAAEERAEERRLRKIR